MSVTDGPELSPTAPRTLEEAHALLKSITRGKPPTEKPSRTEPSQAEAVRLQLDKIRQREAQSLRNTRVELAQAVHDRAHLEPLEPTHIAPVTLPPRAILKPQDRPAGPMEHIQKKLGGLMAGGVRPGRSNT